MELTGTLTANATIYTTKNNKQVVHFDLAINNRFKMASGEIKTQTEYYRCSFWRGTAISEILTKGSVVTVYGWLSTGAWIDKNGAPRVNLNFSASKVKKVSSGKQMQAA